MDTSSPMGEQTIIDVVIGVDMVAAVARKLSRMEAEAVHTRDRMGAVAAVHSRTHELVVAAEEFR